MFLSKQLLFICHTPDHHTFKKKASWKYYRYISFKIRIYGLQRFSSLNCPVSRAWLPFSISLPFMRVAQISADRLLSEIERVLQSYEEFVVDQSLEIEVIHVKLPSGKGNKKKCYVDLEKSLKEKKSFIKINNRDQLCCARAIVTAKARIDKHPKWNSIRKGLNLFNSWYIILKEKWYMYHVLRVYDDFGLFIWLFTISLKK